MRCRARTHDVDSVIPVFLYAGAVASLIGAYKTGKRTSLAPWFASILAGELAARWPGATIVPVPPRPEKAGGRDWDPVDAIVRHMASTGLSVARCLYRSPSAQQKSLKRQDRDQNSRLAYHLIEGATVPGTAVIVDDVFTTGSTIETCARLLKSSGSNAVHALVLAAD